jgi:hypothetical protein
MASPLAAMQLVSQLMYDVNRTVQHQKLAEYVQDKNVPSSWTFVILC